MANSIISDGDSVFMSKFWKKIFTLQGSTLCFSFRYHPLTDEQMTSYDTGYHTAAKMTSYEIVYGQPFLLIHSYEIGTTKVESIDA